MQLYKKTQQQQFEKNKYYLGIKMKGSYIDKEDLKTITESETNKPVRKPRIKKETEQHD